MHTERGERWLAAYGFGLCCIPGKSAGVDPEKENRCIWNIDEDGRIKGGCIFEFDENGNIIGKR